MESEHGKLFVGGISQVTSEEALKDYFGKYGEVKECEILRERFTGKGRGFGFVTFADVSLVDKALQDEHVILGRPVEVKLAKPKGEKYLNQLCRNQPKNNGSNRNNCDDNNGNKPFSAKKIFVGGLPSNLTEEEFKSYFLNFGAITDVVVMYDKENDRSRGFGFITFESEEAVDNVLRTKFHNLNNKFVEVKRAEPKDRISKHISTYDCYNTGLLGFERLSVSDGCGLQLPYYPSHGVSSACMLPYGSVSGYYYGANSYGAGFPTRFCNGEGYETSSEFAPNNSYLNPISYGNPVMYPTYINGGGCINGWASGPVNVPNGDGNYHGSAACINGWVSGPVDFPNGNDGSYHGSAAPVVYGNSNETDIVGDGAACPESSDAQPDLLQTDDVACPERSDAEQQKQEDCQLPLCKSS
ncbi:hypothetical protein U1Q18_012004 [Sarracenia purpurea var. burkii]